MTSFPTSKIELHQWANSILLGIVGFFVIQTYNTIRIDHEKLANHETRITVNESKIADTNLGLSNLVGHVEAIREYKRK